MRPGASYNLLRPEALEAMWCAWLLRAPGVLRAPVAWACPCMCAASLGSGMQTICAAESGVAWLATARLDGGMSAYCRHTLEGPFLPPLPIW